MEVEPPSRVRIWDLPTRVFHWSLALGVTGLFITGKLGGAAMLWHSRIGYAVGSLILFRLAWGLVGGHWSRFAAFSYRPSAVLHYLQGRAEPAHTVGHTPLGAGSVFALLFFLAAQVATGLFSDDKADFAGPLNILVSNRTAELLTAYHQNVGEPVLIVLVLMHLGAIAWYQLLQGRNLVGPMWHGDKPLASSVPASRDDARSRFTALLLFGLCCAALAGLVALGG